MEKGFGPPSAESAPPYPGPPVNFPGPAHPSAPALSPAHSAYATYDSAPPYPGPPSHSPGRSPAQAAHPGGVYCAPMTTLTGPPHATRPPMHYAPGPQQPAMYPMQPGPHYHGGPAYVPVPTTAVVVQSPAPVYTTTVVASVLQDVPGQAMCPHCQQMVITRTEHTSGLMAWLICAGLCLVGCGLCSCIPFCVESCQDVEHHCPNCQRILYVYKRMK